MLRLSTGIQAMNLEVQEGEIFGLLGLNGSGKTTTIKLLLGLLQPTKGTVSVLGFSPQKPAALSKIGYLPEIPYFYPYLSAEELLFFYGQISNLRRETLSGKVSEVLETMGLRHVRKKRMGEFSKGMLQRVGIAQAMLHEPQLFILDEPVTGLDPLAVREMRQRLAHLNNAGRTIFFSSHSISEVEKLCHRVAILVSGKLVKTVSREEWGGQEGRLEEIFVETVQKNQT